MLGCNDINRCGKPSWSFMYMVNYDYSNKYPPSAQGIEHGAAVQQCMRPLV